MLNLFHVILYQPIFNAFVGLYNLIPGHDVGAVILVVTILVRLAVYPLTNSSIKAQKSMQEIQPKLDEIKKQYADDKQKQTQAIMEMYKNNKVNPFASCLPLLVQLPILIALYAVLRDGLASANLSDSLYSFVSNPGQINPISLGYFDMAKANVALAALAGLAQYWQARMTIKKQPPKEAGAGGKDEGMMATMNKQMLYFMPVMTVFIGLSLPAGLTLYWFFSTVLMGLQQLYLFRKKK
ncbi:MAG: YidC/Oxa1 family membrane protein insertase [Patescibacteria group bacterium]|nr:YidC/Oxa1 family membrane protein insertase [Patescibacteria group bacterium]